jgi:hypothetical protein
LPKLGGLILEFSVKMSSLFAILTIKRETVAVLSFVQLNFYLIAAAARTPFNLSVRVIHFQRFNPLSQKRPSFRIRSANSSSAS